MTYSTAHALVLAQAMEAQSVADGRLAHEMMAALTAIVVPDPMLLQEIQRDPQLPDGALAALAATRRQMSYLLIELPSVGDLSTFVNGAWLIRDVAAETNEPLFL